MTDQDQDVRDMLRAKAGSIRPSTDGLRAIEARLAAPPAVRRRPPVALLAAAAVLVIAMVGAALVLRGGDATSVDVGPVATTPTTTAEGGFSAYVPPGVWPWPDDVVDQSVLDDPVETARAYVASRVRNGVGVTTDSGFLQGDASSGEVVFTGDVSTTVLLRLDADRRWYVVASSSDLVTAHDRDDGLTVVRIETSGELAHSVSFSDDGIEGDGGDFGTVVGGYEYELAYTLGRDDVAQRELFVLETDDTTAITELSLRASDAPGEAAAAELPAGVWPWPDDTVDESVLDDPVETARAYVEARIGGATDRTTVSAYRAGDTSSGEVVFGGDIQTTVFVRELAGRWHVEGAASDFVTLHDGGDGSLTAVVEASGWLQSHVTLSSGSSEPLVSAAQYAAGSEIADGLAYDLNTDRLVKAVRFLLTTGENGTKALTEVAFRPPFAD